MAPSNRTFDANLLLGSLIRTFRKFFWIFAWNLFLDHVQNHPKPKTGRDPKFSVFPENTFQTPCKTWNQGSKRVSNPCLEKPSSSISITLNRLWNSVSFRAPWAEQNTCCNVIIPSWRCLHLTLPHQNCQAASISCSKLSWPVWSSSIRWNIFSRNLSHGQGCWRVQVGGDANQKQQKNQQTCPGVFEIARAGSLLSASASCSISSAKLSMSRSRASAKVSTTFREDKAILFHTNTFVFGVSRLVWVIRHGARLSLFMCFVRPYWSALFRFCLWQAVKSQCGKASGFCLASPYHTQNERNTTHYSGFCPPPKIKKMQLGWWTRQVL